VIFSQTCAAINGSKVVFSQRSRRQSGAGIAFAAAFERLELYYGLLLKLNGFARRRLFLVGLVNGVEYAVDEWRRLFGRELLGELERFVDDYLGRR